MRKFCVAWMIFSMVFLLTSSVLASECKSLSDLLKEAKSVVKEISVDDVYNKYYKKEGVVFIDVRSFREVDKYGYIPSAKLIPRGFLEFMIERIVPDRKTKIVVYCQTGKRSLLAARTLKKMGYENVFSMSGGFLLWLKKGFPVKH